MKLQARYNYVNLATTVVVLLITGIIYYQAISWILTWQKDKDLRDEEQEIFEYVTLNHHLPQTFETNDEHISFFTADSGSVKREFINTVYFKKWDRNDHLHQKRHRGDGRYEPGRGLVTSVTAGNRYYKVLIVESVVENEDLIQLIFAITTGVILLLLVVLLLINRLLLRKLWQPFYTIMADLQMFNIAETGEIIKLSTSTDEFRDLNTVVTEMTNKAKLDYNDLKTFTENAAHELMTPIAVINSKLDTLIQNGNYNEKQSGLFNDLYRAVARLNRLNQSLLLLVKIENRLLHDQEEIDLKDLSQETLLQLEEIFNDKKLKVTSNLSDKKIIGSRYLAEILLNNLLTNAIRHNYNGGEVDVTLTSDALVVKNTGENRVLNQDQIFARFNKSSESEGSGLGLTISKQICSNFGFSLTYAFVSGYHTFIVSFT
jgi:signal transduction histidine kinase